MLMRGNPLPAPNNPLPAVQGNPLGDIPPDILQKIQQGVAEGNPMAIQAAQALKIPISGQTNAAVMPQGVQARMNASAPQPGLLNTPNAPVPSTIAPNQNTGAPAASAVAQNMMAQPAQAPMPQQAQAVTAQAASAPAAPTNDKGFLGIPKELMYGAGMGLLARSRDPNADVMGAFLTGSQQFKKQQGVTDLAKQIDDSNLSPVQKALAKQAIMTGDAKAIDTIAKMITPNLNNTNKFGAPIGVTDPKTGKLKYVQVNPAGEVREVQGVAPINRYATAFQKEEANVQNKVLKFNGLSNVDPDNVINAYLDGSQKLEDGTILKPMTPALYNDFSAYVAKTSNTATISKALRANTAHAEMESFKPFIQANLEKYGTTYWNKSPDAFIDSFKNDDASQKNLGNLIAANVLSNATMNAINSVDFGEAGETAVQRLLDESKAAISTNYPRLSGKARSYALDALMEQQTKALRVRNNYGIGAVGAIGIPQQQAGQPSSNDSLEQMAQQAIAQGADPEKVRARLAQLRGQQG